MKRRDVTVPVVVQASRPGDPAPVGFCTLWCDQGATGAPPTGVPSNTDPQAAQVAAALNTANLYLSGCVAAMAVRKLGLGPAWFAPWQRLHPHAWLESRSLYAADDIPAMGPSAELGLALALLLPTARYRGQVMATGKLSDAPDEPPAWLDEPGQAQDPKPQSGEVRPKDVAVRPVGSVAEKLAGLRERIAAAAADGSDQARGLCFTPLTDDRGRPVAQLPVVAELKRLGVEVVPIGWLSEAVKRLGAGRWPLLVEDYLALGAGLVLGAALGFGAATWLWRDWPVPLAFERGGGQAGATEPYIACITPDGRHTVPKPLPSQDQLPLIGAGQKLAWSVRVGAPGAWDARVLAALGSAGYHLLFALIPADGQVILANHTPAGGQQGTSPRYRAGPGEVWEQWVQIPSGPGEGESALVILARRDRPFATDALRQGLDGLGGTPGAERVQRAVNYLQAQAPGFLVYQFGRSSHVPDPCQE